MFSKLKDMAASAKKSAETQSLKIRMAAALASVSNDIFFPKYQVGGVPVFIDCTSVFGMTGVSKNLPNAVALNAKKAIFINQKFLELPVDVQNAIYYHELGHIELGHTSNPTADPKVAMQYEQEADAYARKHNYDIQGALEYLTSNFNYGHAHDALLKRIAFLKQT